ncbi:MAG: HAD family hydrolase [Cocleimonas sp.]|nr:HAD family hydrolase [Cocleimonas sp.]
MTLALFDLDNTLLSGDSDYEWGQFLVRKNLVNKKTYEDANIRFYEQYKQGELDIYEWSAFTFKPLSEHSMEELAALHKEYMQQVILPMMGDIAKSKIEYHRQQGHTLIVITATNSFVTRPIVKAFGIDNLIATESKIVNGRYTTDVEGIPCFNKGKVKRLNAWLKLNNESLKGSYFYSDSHNDLPLLEIVKHPVAVDPDEVLEAIAKQHGWKIMSFLGEC